MTRFLKTLPMKRIAIILASATVYLACLAWTTNLHLDERITAMLPDSNRQAADFKAIMESVPALETLYVDVENLHAADKEQFYAAADLVFEQLDGSPLFRDITYRFSSRDFFHLMAMLGKKRASLFTEGDRKALEARLTKKAIDHRLAEIKRELLNPAGSFMVKRARKDPFDFNTPLVEKLNSLKNEKAGITIQGGRITSRDNKHILILATPAFSAVDTETGKRMMAFLDQVRQTIEKRFNGKITTGFSGNHIATHDNAAAIKGDVKRTVSILAAAIVCMGLLFFRRKVFVLLVFFPTLFSLTAAAALVSSVYPSVSAISLGCGAVLVGITVDFGIHILFSLDNFPHKGPARIVEELRRPIAAGAFTTMTAFTCLLFSSLPGQRQMGLFSLAGVLFAALFACFLLKHFIPGPGSQPKTAVVPLTTVCGRLIDFRQRHTPILMLFCLALLGTGLWGLPRFEFDGDIASLSHLSPQVRKDTDTFLETWGKNSPAIVMVKGKTLDKALDRNDILYRQLTALEKKGVVGQIASLAPVLPSPSVQAENRRRWQAFMSEKRKRELERIVDAALPGLGFAQETFSPFFSSLDTAPRGISKEDFQGTPLEKVMNDKIIVKQDHTLVMTTFHIQERSEVPALGKSIRTHLPEARFLDKQSFIAGSAAVVAHEFKKLLGFAALGMVASLMLFIRPFKAAMITMLPVVSSTVVTAGLLGLMGIPVNLITMLFIVFVFGVGVDFSIFLVTRELSAPEEGGSREAAVTQGAVLLCAMTTMGAFLSLVFARHAALFSIGVAGFVGMGTSLLFSTLLIPVLLEKIVLTSREKQP